MGKREKVLRETLPCSKLVPAVARDCAVLDIINMMLDRAFRDPSPRGTTTPKSLSARSNPRVGSRGPQLVTRLGSPALPRIVPVDAAACRAYRDPGGETAPKS